MGVVNDRGGGGWVWLMILYRGGGWVGVVNDRGGGGGWVWLMILYRGGCGWVWNDTIQRRRVVSVVSISIQMILHFIL